MGMYYDVIVGVDGIFLVVLVYNWGLGLGMKVLIEFMGSFDVECGLYGVWFD